MLLKYTVNFYLEKRSNNRIDQNGSPAYPNAPILMFFTFEGKRLQYFTGYRIDSWKWDPDSQQVRRNNFNKDGISAQVINDRMDRLSTVITDLYQKRKILDKPVTVQWLKKALGDQLSENQRVTKNLLDLLEDYIAEKRRVNTPGTVKKYITLKNHLTDFQKRTRINLVPESVTTEFLQRFISFLLEEKNFVNSTTAKTIKLLKAFLAWVSALDLEISVDQSFRKFKHNLKGVDSFGSSKTKTVIYLTWPEFQHLFDLEIPKHYLAQVRDVFCFLCATGMRYSDVFNLKWSNIKAGYIEYTTIKTEESVRVELNEYSRAILEKYRETTLPGDKCLPVVSNQKMNKYLKELGQLAELTDMENLVHYKGPARIETSQEKWQLLTTHVGKKTFITNAIFWGIPIDVVKGWTGNKDDRMLKFYYKILDQQRVTEMQKFNRKTV
jgi:integrase